MGKLLGEAVFPGSCPGSHRWQEQGAADPGNSLRAQRVKCWAGRPGRRERAKECVRKRHTGHQRKA